ncbi:hypothetical protein [Cohaesibacter marisflavi]|uniref:hypothetical protein n=1 Tax=Cohaesibacter marisflavi TaxID=655353 RepID=UPI0029C9248E|nr:hypothetical protein [Cohaesibacter marisflavi]
MTFIPKTKGSLDPKAFASGFKPLSFGNLIDLVQTLPDFKTKNGQFNPSHKKIQYWTIRGYDIFELENGGSLITYKFVPHDDDADDLIGLSFESAEKFLALFLQSGWRDAVFAAAKDLA